jgi:peroxiredoxin Q/BCP
MSDPIDDPMNGTPAPPFCLPDAAGEEHCLADLLGRWVALYFYPRDNTSGCTLEARLFSDALPAFEVLGATVIGVSRDSPASHARFAEKHALRHRLLSDEDHAVLERYGVWKEKRLYGKVTMGTERSTFLIDPEGVVRAVWRKVKVPGHPDAVREALEALQGAIPA